MSFPTALIATFPCLLTQHSVSYTPIPSNSLQDLRNNMAGNQVCSRCLYWLKRSLPAWACTPMAGGFLCSWANETAGCWGKGQFPAPDLLSVPLWMSPASTNVDAQSSWSKDGKREGMSAAILLNCLIVSPYSVLWNCALRMQTTRQPQPCIEATPPGHSSLQCPPSSLSPRLLPARMYN